MPITFLCSCGQSITVGDHFAGKMGRCPGCKNPVTVPMQSAAPAGTPNAQPRPTAPKGASSGPAPVARSTQDGRPGTQSALPRPPKPSGAQAKAPPKVTAKLQVVNGPQGVVGRSFGLVGGKPNVIGRDPQVDIPIPSDRISRRHCQLEPTADGVFVLTDLGSSNGTLVNQEKIAGRKVLLGGEYVQIGDVLLRFLDQ